MKRRSFLAGAIIAATAPAMPKDGPADARPATAAKKPAVKGILELNPPELVEPMLQNMQMRAIRADKNGPTPQQEQLTLLHFADIHHDTRNLRRVMEFAARYKPYITDILLTGDIAGGCWQDWNGELMTVPGFRDGVLKTLGNHDVYRWNRHPLVNVPARECYERYFAGIGNWGVTQPGGTNPDGLCYWYKDYPASRVRLIALDCMHYDDAHDAWFAATLEDARARKLAVVAAHHLPPADAKDMIGLPGCAFDSPQRDSLGGSLPRAVDTVSKFQKAGGEFACWLAGHTHTDFCGTVKGTGQMYVIVGAANNRELWCDSRRVTGEKSQDLFNVLSIDTFRKHIRVARIGAEWNRFLQHRVAMCLDYAAGRQVV